MENKIEKIFAREILDSRGNPTLEVEITVGGKIVSRAAVPSGASTGSMEALELRDKDEERFDGKGVLKAVKNVNRIIAPELLEMNILNQREIDEKLIKLDGTENKSKLGANAILGVSLAVCKGAANILNIPIYKYIGGINSSNLPLPMCNIINGGKHADNKLCIQEFMIIPLGAESFKEAITMVDNVYMKLKKILKEEANVTSVGDEGGFAANFAKEEDAIEKIIEAIEKAGYEPGKDIYISLDVAANEMYEEAKKKGMDGYYFWKRDIQKTEEEMQEYYKELVNKYPIFSIEDPFAENDIKAWKKITENLGDKIILVGDDLFVTNTERLEMGVEESIANAILIKPNQIGTLTETLETIELAKKSGYNIVISHRSGETEDTVISDIAVGINADFIKSGAPCRMERVSKYNQLLRIEEDMEK